MWRYFRGTWRRHGRKRPPPRSRARRTSREKWQSTVAHQNNETIVDPSRPPRRLVIGERMPTVKSPTPVRKAFVSPPLNPPTVVNERVVKPVVVSPPGGRRTKLLLTEENAGCRH